LERFVEHYRPKFPPRPLPHLVRSGWFDDEAVEKFCLKNLNLRLDRLQRTFNHFAFSFAVAYLLVFRCWFLGAQRKPSSYLSTDQRTSDRGPKFFGRDK